MIYWKYYTVTWLVTGAINTGSYPIVFNTIHGNNLGCISVKGTIQVLNRRSIIVYVSNETYVCILCCWGASWFWSWRDLPGLQALENSHHASPSADNITHVPVFYITFKYGDCKQMRVKDLPKVPTQKQFQREAQIHALPLINRAQHNITCK